MESTTRTKNLATLRDYFSKIATGDVDLLATFWHDDLVFEAPFSFTGTPSRTSGKQAVYERLSTSYGLVTMAFEITVVHELVDPDAFMVEYTSTGRMLHDNSSYENVYITLVQFTAGKISLFREFYDSRRCAAAFAPLLSADH
ncbi:MAG: nuclear transport factor 2 family protein [Acidimicrobiales bacterium]